MDEHLHEVLWAIHNRLGDIAECLHRVSEDNDVSIARRLHQLVQAGERLAIEAERGVNRD